MNRRVRCWVFECNTCPIAVFAPQLHAGTEIRLSRLYRRKAMFAAILADRERKGYVRHIGWDRTVPEPVA